MARVINAPVAVQQYTRRDGSSYWNIMQRVEGANHRRKVTSCPTQDEAIKVADRMNRALGWDRPTPIHTPDCWERNNKHTPPPAAAPSLKLVPPPPSLSVDALADRIASLDIALGDEVRRLTDRLNDLEEFVMRLIDESGAA